MRKNQIMLGAVYTDDKEGAYAAWWMKANIASFIKV